VHAVPHTGLRDPDDGPEADERDRCPGEPPSETHGVRVKRKHVSTAAGSRCSELQASPGPS